MRKQDRKWLVRIKDATDNYGGMYPGINYTPDGPRKRLYRAGYVSPYIPHNPVHKETLIVTQAGREALEST